MVRVHAPALILLACLCLTACDEKPQPDAPPKATPAVDANTWTRTAFYFGLARKDGGPVTDGEWEAFLEEDLTSRFPGGLTVLDGYGQYRNEAGHIIQEATKILIILHPFGDDARQKLQAVAQSYKKRFQQESVLVEEISAKVRFE